MSSQADAPRYLGRRTVDGLGSGNRDATGVTGVTGASGDTISPASRPIRTALTRSFTPSFR